ncbi:unnamed protein product, partial [Allacma fusca]
SRTQPRAVNSNGILFVQLSQPRTPSAPH